MIIYQKKLMTITCTTPDAVALVITSLPKRVGIAEATLAPTSSLNTESARLPRLMAASFGKANAYPAVTPSNCDHLSLAALARVTETLPHLYDKVMTSLPC